MVTCVELQRHVFGYALSESGLLADAVMYHVQEELMKLSTVLTRQGLAAFGVAIEQETAMMQRLVAGRDGERNLTDFLHIFEAMDALVPLVVVLHSRLLKHSFIY